MFDPCITHQNLVNKIKGLEAILGPFSLICYAISPQARADLERIFAQDPTFEGLELFQPSV